MPTNVYNIAFAESHKQAYLHFWGCNIDCRGCVCKKVVTDFMLDRNMHLHLEEFRGLAAPPSRFLEVDEVVDLVGETGAKWVLFEGQEASIDPQMPFIAEALHRKFNTHNVLLTNGFQMPSLKHIDKVGFGIKAFDEYLHKDYTGHSNKTIFENFIKVYRSGVPMMAETVVIPSYIDINEVDRIARFIASVDKTIPYQLDAYLKAGDNPWRRPTVLEMDEAVAIARKHLDHPYSYRGDETREFGVKSIFPTESDLAVVEQASIEAARMPALT